jgi:hypothetical protein
MLLGGIAVLWVVGLGIGLRTSLNYENGPAAPGQAPAEWPQQSRIPRRAGLPTIVVMAHPHCPCTKATVGELAVLMAHAREQASAVVVFVIPKGVPENWEQTDLWANAAEIPGVSVMKDRGGTEAELFGALASGQTMLYDAAGKLQFSGGITASRGHFGDNAGRSAIEGFVGSAKSEIKTAPVFGCYLGDPHTRAKGGS